MAGRSHHWPLEIGVAQCSATRTRIVRSTSKLSPLLSANTASGCTTSSAYPSAGTQERSARHSSRAAQVLAKIVRELEGRSEFIEKTCCTAHLFTPQYPCGKPLSRE